MEKQIKKIFISICDHTCPLSRAPKSEKSEELACRKISRQLALVEQWRGVERPLSAQSRILKLWNAWGEEKSQVIRLY